MLFSSVWTANDYGCDWAVWQKFGELKLLRNVEGCVQVFCKNPSVWIGGSICIVSQGLQASAASSLGLRWCLWAKFDELIPTRSGAGRLANGVPRFYKKLNRATTNEPMNDLRCFN